jgi:hypothetical protein
MRRLNFTRSRSFIVTCSIIFMSPSFAAAAEPFGRDNLPIEWSVLAGVVGVQQPPPPRPPTRAQPRPDPKPQPCPPRPLEKPGPKSPKPSPCPKPLPNGVR